MWISVLRFWIPSLTAPPSRWARSTASPNRIALGTLIIYDTVAGFTVVCTGVSLQKVPDRTFDRTGTTT